MMIAYASFYSIVRYGGGRTHAQGRHDRIPLLTRSSSTSWDCSTESLKLMEDLCTHDLHAAKGALERTRRDIAAQNKKLGIQW